jgi:hypothetical protein
MAQEEHPIFYYTKRQERVDLWDPGLTLAIVYALAAFIVMPLTGKVSRAKQVMDQANALILEARVASANSDENYVDTVPDWITARGYAQPGPMTRFYYPYGPMLAMAEIPGVR